MINVAICDDEKPIREYLKTLTKECMDARVMTFETGEALLNSPVQFDVVLLDISLGEGVDTPNGVDIARTIRETSDPIVIFVTALRGYVFEAYDVGAFHYLLKPVDEEKFREVMRRAAAQLKKTKKEKSLVIRSGGTTVNIPVCDIIYAENEGRKIVLYTKNSKESGYTFYGKMKELEQELGDPFFRSHRGFLVNLAEVSGYDRSDIVMKNGAKVFLAKQKYNGFVAAYRAYLEK